MKTIQLQLLKVYYNETKAVVFSPYRSYYTVNTDGTTKAIDLLVDVLFSKRDTDSAYPSSNVINLDNYLNGFEDTIPIDIRKAG